ncbi:MAG TPA: hypothetical protein VFS00_24810, partial [Polyangiaceae bacterium]|nr:hypothetical protein [Polyangiaceae bacterium]
MLFRLSPRVTFCLALPLTAALAACAPSNADPAPAGERVATSAQPLAAGLPLVSRAAAALAGAPAVAAGRDAGPKSGDELFALARGRWVGHCDILVPGRDEPVDTVEMERITESTDDPNAFSWTIIYRAPGL